jgi:hypothetical protein
MTLREYTDVEVDLCNVEVVEKMKFLVEKVAERLLCELIMIMRVI